MSVYAHTAQLVWRSVAGILLTWWFQISLLNLLGFLLCAHRWSAVCTQMEVGGPVAW